MRVGAIAAALAIGAGAVIVGAPNAAAAPGCSPWTVSTVASGFGMLENLAFDNEGTLYLSETSPFGPGRIQALTPGGDRRVAVPDVTSPGGLVVTGEALYFATGNGTAAGLFGTREGTIDSLDLASGVRSTYADGLTMPNGLAVTPTGELLATRNLGAGNGLTVVPAAAPHEPVVVRTDLGTANGIAVDGETVYVANTFDPVLTISVLDVSDLSGSKRTIAVDGFGPFTASDDLTVDSGGQIYLAQNLAGRVLRIDPVTGRSCVIGTGIPLTSSVEFGTDEWDSASLYATSFDGTVRKLTPA